MSHSEWSQQETHRVAVIGYVTWKDKFLLLKRNNPPLVWAPPGGRLLPGEAPEVGLRREIMEEAGLQIEILDLVEVWFGEHEGQDLLSINYLARSESKGVRLSVEHSDFAWVSCSQLATGDPITLDPHQGFHLENFQKAEKILLR